MQIEIVVEDAVGKLGSPNDDPVQRWRQVDHGGIYSAQPDGNLSHLGTRRDPGHIQRDFGPGSPGRGRKARDPQQGYPLLSQRPRMRATTFTQDRDAVV